MKFPCENCGVITSHRTGKCQKCRTKTCSTCGDDFIMRTMGIKVCYTCKRKAKNPLGRLIHTHDLRRS